MSTNEFDKLVKEKFDEHEFAYNPLNWDKLSRELPVEKRTRRLLPWLTGIAASVALLAGSYWFFHNAPDKTNDIATQQQSQEQIQTQTPQPSEDLQPKKEIIPSNPAQNALPLPANNNLMLGHVKPSAVDDDIMDNIRNTAQTALTKTTNTPVNTHQEPVSTITPDPVNKPNVEIVTNSTPVHPVPAKSITEDLNNPILFSPEEKQTHDRKTAVSIAGGVNYGSLNTGYMASVNARKKLGKKLFVEGDLGFMRNQEVMASSMSTSQFNTVASNTGPSRPARIDEKPNNIYYIQMSPSLGYQLQKNISIGVGADVQKLLDGNSQDRPVITTEQGFKLVPLWDAGITGKTEYTISNRIKAGILYREGINNLIQGSNNYFERRYIQVQMKLKLFGK